MVLHTSFGRLCVAAAFLAASGGAAPARDPKIELKIGGKAQSFTWREYKEDGAELLEETGLRQGIAGSMEMLTWPVGCRVELEVGGGRVNYDGETWGGDPVETDVDYSFVGLDLYLMGRIPLGLRSGCAIRIVSGLALDVWSRDLNSTGQATGYVEDWLNIEGRLGLGADLAFGPIVHLTFEAGAKVPVYTQNSPDILDGVVLKPEQAVTPFASLRLEVTHAFIEVQYEHWKWDPSDTEWDPDVGGVLQPESEAFIVALNVGACWRL